MDLLTDIFSGDSLAASLRVAAPLLLACIAGLYSERAGVFDIGLEGKMLIAAFFAGAAAFWSGSAWIGLAAGMGASVVFAAVHALASIALKGDQIVSGVAINFLAVGVTAMLGEAWFHQGGATPMVSGAARFQDIDLPFAAMVADVPLLGDIYTRGLSGHNILVYIAFALPFVTLWIIARTRFGLRLRAVGENPAALDVAGGSPNWMRLQAVLICGLLCGIAGAYLSIAQGASFGREMTSGRGFMALAALIFAKWRPIQAMLACLMFGFLDAASIRLSTSVQGVPNELFDALPYVLTLLLLAGVIGRAIPPAAGGKPYVKER